MSPLIMVLAVLPAVFLIIYIYKKDKHDKEPFGLLASLFVLGALTTISSMIVEVAFGSIAGMILPPDSIPYKFIENFFIVAATEEVGKYVVLRLRTWKSPEFNYTFDAVVYAVVVSLGFATLENILYLMNGSLETAIARAVLSVPGHAINGVFMGFFYGVAKHAQRMGNNKRCSTNLWLALIAPVIIHGLYDFFISIEMFVPFLAFEVVITVIAVKYINRLSKDSVPL
ncbi:MAG: PrsW family intramembrane metalloprotease [Atopobiaceae bacterium]|nr:PrsW family intramembrane metalloprotease [Atopobiaceae bacterium]